MCKIENQTGICNFKEYEDYLKYVVEEKEADEKIKNAYLNIQNLKLKIECQEKVIKDNFKIKESYKESGKVIKAHAYWSNKNFTVVNCIKKFESNYYIKYICYTKDSLREYSSSSKGILMSTPVPITKEKFEEIISQWNYDKFKN